MTIEKLTKAKKKRMINIDLLRILATFSVIILHESSTYFSSISVDSYEWSIFNIYNSIVRYSVPIFVMISGMLFLNSNKEFSIKTIYTKYIPRIAGAFLFWSTAYSLYTHYLKYSNINISIIPSILNNIILGHYHLWYLYAIVGLYMIVPFLSKIVKDKKLTEYFLILSFIFTFVFNALKLIPDVSSTLNAVMNKTFFHFTLGYVGYFILGHYLSYYDIKPIHQKLMYVLGILSIIITITLTKNLSIESGEAVKSIYNNLLPNVLFPASALFIFFKYEINKIKFNDKIQKLIIHISNHSFGIYLSHVFIMYFVRDCGLKVISFNPALSIPFISIIVFLLGYLLTIILKKIPFIKKFVN